MTNYFIATSDGFLKFRISNDSSIIYLEGITKNIRKATTTSCYETAIRVAKVAMARRYTKESYYAILTNSIGVLS